MNENMIPKDFCGNAHLGKFKKAIFKSLVTKPINVDFRCIFPIEITHCQIIKANAA